MSFSISTKPGGAFVSRHNVLASLAAGAAPLFLPSRWFGADAPSNKLRIVMFGTGRQAYHTTIPTLLGMPGMVAVCDEDRNRAEESKKKVNEYYGDEVCRLHTDFREGRLLAWKPSLCERIHSIRDS